MSIPSAGRLNRRIQIQVRSQSSDDYAQQLVSWSTVITCWARIRQLGGRELVTAQTIKAESTHEIEIRYRPGITAEHRIVYQGRVFNILNTTDPDTSHTSLLISCSEGLNQG